MQTKLLFLIIGTSLDGSAVLALAVVYLEL